MNQLFILFRVDAAEAQCIAQAPDEPYQHDFEELIIGVEGQLERFIDFRTATIAAPLLSFVTKGKAHCVQPVRRREVASKEQLERIDRPYGQLTADRDAA
ncbi:MAG TPA: hypothetical protein PKY96_10295 [Flavobacteriales bacterium]|nr:hypothetical protein [Flavobacteriales bacterium]